MTEHTIDAPQAGGPGTPEVSGAPEVRTFTDIRRDTFDSPEAAATRCNHILTDIRVIGERAKNAMIAGYTEAQKAEINLDDYYRRMQAIYDDAKNQIDTIEAGLIATRHAIAAPENTLPNKADLLSALNDGIAQASTAKADIIRGLEQQRERRPFDEQIEKALDSTRQAFAAEAAAGTLPRVDRSEDGIEATVKAEIADINANKKPEDLKKDSLARAEQYEGLELRARAIGLTKLLEERLATVDAILEAQAKRNEYQQGFLYKACDFLASYKLIANNDWRDPAKSGLPARFVGNITAGTVIKLGLSLGALGAVTAAGAGFGGAVASGFMITRSAVSAVMGYFAGEKFARGYAERNAAAAGSQEIPVPEDNEALQKVTDEQLADWIARMEYKALISGKSLRRTQGEIRQDAAMRAAAAAAAVPANPTGSTNPFDLGARTSRPEPVTAEAEGVDPNAVIIDPAYKRLIEELQRRSTMDTEGARSYAVSLETKIRQANAQLRELLQDREKVDQVAKIGGVLGAAAAVFLPAMFRGGLEASGWVGGPDGSFTHGTLAGLVGKDGADLATGTGGYSPDASAAVHVGPGVPGTGTAEAAAKTVANTPTPTGPSGPPPAPSASSVPYGPEAPQPVQMINGQPVYGPELPPTASGAPGIPTPEPGSFVPDKAEFTHYIVGKGEGVSWPLKAQLIEHADKYGWDGKGDKAKWATKKMLELMKSEEFTIDGKSMAIYNADINKQLWVDQPDRYSFILKYDGKGGYSMDVYDMKAPGGPTLLSGNYDQALSEHTISDPQRVGSGTGHQPSGSHGPAPQPAPAPQGPGVTNAFDKNGNLITPGGSGVGNTATVHPSFNGTEKQFFKSQGIKGLYPEGQYLEKVAGKIVGQGDAGFQYIDAAIGNDQRAAQAFIDSQAYTFFNKGELAVHFNASSNSTATIHFTSDFKGIESTSGTVPKATYDKLFDPAKLSDLVGKDKQAADELARLVQGEGMLSKLSSSAQGYNATELTRAQGAIGRRIAALVKKLGREYTGLLLLDERPR